MKTNKLGQSKIALLSALLALSPAVLMAQDDSLLNDTESVLNSDQIDIDGTYRKRSAADKIEKMRKQLEQKNEQMVQKKIEDIRIKNEQKLTNQLSSAFNGGAIDTVSTTSSAVQKVEVKAPEVKEEKTGKVIPSFGVQQFNGEGINGFETTAAVNVALEAMVGRRISVGVDLGYAAMDIKNTNNSFNNYYPYYGSTNYNYLSEGDQINYNRFSIGVKSKVFLTTAGKFRPYLGAGLNYHRTTLKYEDKNTQVSSYYGPTFSNNQDENDGVTGSNVSGTAIVGAEFNFTETIGMNLEFNYNRSLTDGFNEDQTTRTSFGYDYNETVLRNIGSRLDNSDMASINLGLVVHF